MQYEIISNYHKNDSLRKLFNELSVKTFGLDFENWYQSGYWNDKYIPYSVLADGKIISNVSVNIIACTVCGRERHYIQLGTIMTDEEYRKQAQQKSVERSKYYSLDNCVNRWEEFLRDEVLG